MISFGGLLVALAVVLQAAPVFFPWAGLILSPEPLVGPVAVAFFHFHLKTLWPKSRSAGARLSKMKRAWSLMMPNQNEYSVAGICSVIIMLTPQEYCIPYSLPISSLIFYDWQQLVGDKQTPPPNRCDELDPYMELASSLGMGGASCFLWKEIGRPVNIKKATFNLPGDPLFPLSSINVKAW